MSTTPMSAQSSWKRERIVIWIAFAGALVVVFRLGYFMLIHHEYLTRKAREQQIREKRLPAVRGNICDRIGA